MKVGILDFGEPQRLARKQFESSEAAKDFSGTMYSIAADMLEIEKKIFNSQGRRGGGRWKALSPETIRKKSGGDQRILFTEGTFGYGDSSGTNALYRSVTEPDGPDQILHVTKTRITFGTDRPYARRIQRGGGGIPARPFIRFSPSDLKRWNGMFVRHILKPFFVGGTPSSRSPR